MQSRKWCRHSCVKRAYSTINWCVSVCVCYMFSNIFDPVPTDQIVHIPHCHANRNYSFQSSKRRIHLHMCVSAIDASSYASGFRPTDAHRLPIRVAGWLLEVYTPAGNCTRLRIVRTLHRVVMNHNIIIPMLACCTHYCSSMLPAANRHFSLANSSVPDCVIARLLTRRCALVNTSSTQHEHPLRPKTTHKTHIILTCHGLAQTPTHRKYRIF